MILFKIATLTLFCVIMSLAQPGTAAPDDRMPGRIPVSQPRAEGEEKPTPTPVRVDESRTAPAGRAQKEQVKKEEDGEKPAPKPEKTPAPKPEPKAEEKPATKPTPAPASDPVVNTPKPNTGKTMDIRAMESLGPLSNPLLGSLGDDMWDGTRRSAVVEWLPQLPQGDVIRPMQLLARRLLLTNGDVRMLRGDQPPAAELDLLTLRLEKLLDMGAFQDAVDLYTLIEGEAAHDRLARAGIMALFSAGYPAQACLEIRAAHRTVHPMADAERFWPWMDATCAFVQAQSVRAVRDPDLIRVSAQTLPDGMADAVADLPALSALLRRSDYRHSIATPKDLKDLHPVERAVLRGLGRLDYSRLKLRSALDDVDAPVLMTIATDRNAPAAIRTDLMIEAARRGLVTPDMLGAFYLSLEGTGSGVAARYAAYNTAEQGRARNGILGDILDSPLTAEPVALLPFAAGVPDLNPANLSQKQIEAGLELMLEAGMLPPARWVRAWLAGESSESSDSVKNRKKVILYLANLLPENLPTDSIPFPDETLTPVFESPESAEAREIWALFSGLRRANALHNAADPKVYEKLVDLTVHDDYVMPVDGLMNQIRDAARQGRIGETVLLGAVALKGHTTGTNHPAIFTELLVSLDTVGLKEEARHLALGVMLGFKQ